MTAVLVSGGGINNLSFWVKTSFFHAVLMFFPGVFLLILLNMAPAATKFLYYLAEVDYHVLF